MHKSDHLALNAEFGEEIFNAAPVGMALASRNYRILRANRAF